MIARSSTKKELQEYAMANFGVKLHGRMSEAAMFNKIQEMEVSNGMRKEAQEQEAAEEEVSQTIGIPVHGSNDFPSAMEMNVLALRIWEGQSTSLPRHERERRIKAALVDKGYSDILDKLELPE